MTTPLAEAPPARECPNLPFKWSSFSKATWDAISPSQYQKEGVFTVTGPVEGGQLPNQTHVRVSAKAENDFNISDQWTGSELLALLGL